MNHGNRGARESIRLYCVRYVTVPVHVPGTDMEYCTGKVQQQTTSLATNRSERDHSPVATVLQYRMCHVVLRQFAHMVTFINKPTCAFRKNTCTFPSSRDLWSTLTHHQHTIKRGTPPTDRAHFRPPTGGLFTFVLCV